MLQRDRERSPRRIVRSETRVPRREFRDAKDREIRDANDESESAKDRADPRRE